MIESSALKAPTSARAQSQFAKLLWTFERYDQALETIDRAIEIIPNDDPLLLVNRLYFLCNRDSLEVSEYQALTARVARKPFDSRALKAYNTFASEVVSGSCPNISLELLESMWVRMLDLPENADPKSLRYSHVQYLIGYTRTHAGQPDAALSAFQKSLDSRAGASHAMAMAALMASNEFGEQALVLAERALGQLRKEIAEDPRLMRKVRESDILEFQETVRAELNGAQAASNRDAAD